jgi:hypothetical protein
MINPLLSRLSHRIVRCVISRPGHLSLNPSFLKLYFQKERQEEKDRSDGDQENPNESVRNRKHGVDMIIHEGRAAGQST